MHPTLLANIGIPMIFVHWPLMFVALAPVIVVEAMLVRHWLPLSFRDALIGVARANVRSTAVGVPAAWLLMLALEFAILLPLSIAAEKWHWNLESSVANALFLVIGAAWIGPPGPNSSWMIPFAAAVLLIPCFYMSVRIEHRSCERAWPAADPAALRRGIYFSNLGSYILLFMFACAWMAWDFHPVLR